MRNLVLFLIGIAVGAAFATITVNTLARRDAYLRGVMEVMQHHVADLKAGIRAANCGSDLAQAKPTLSALAESVEAAYAPDGTPPAAFREYTQRLRDAIAALPAAPAQCGALAPALTKVTEACDACHREYR